jgi:hypothetical protein
MAARDPVTSLGVSELHHGAAPEARPVAALHSDEDLIGLKAALRQEGV